MTNLFLFRVTPEDLLKVFLEEGGSLPGCPRGFLGSHIEQFATVRLQLIAWPITPALIYGQPFILCWLVINMPCA